MKEQLLSNLESSEKFSFSTCFSQSWKLYKDKAGMLIGFTLLSWLMIFVGFIIVGIIPIVGFIAILIAGYPAIFALYNGFLVVARKYKNGEPVDFNDLFKGFKSLGKMIGVWFVYIILALPMMGLFFWLSGYAEIFSSIISGGGQDPQETMAWVMNFYQTMWWLQLIMMVYAAVIVSVFFYAVPIIVDTDLSISESFELALKAFTKNMVPIILFNTLAFFGMYAAMLPCFLGLLVYLPMMYFIMFNAYNNAFNPYGQSTFKDKIDEFGESQMDINTESQEGNY